MRSRDWQSGSDNGGIGSGQRGDPGSRGVCLTQAVDPALLCIVGLVLRRCMRGRSGRCVEPRCSGVTTGISVLAQITHFCRASSDRSS